MTNRVKVIAVATFTIMLVVTVFAMATGQNGANTAQNDEQKNNEHQQLQIEINEPTEQLNEEEKEVVVEEEKEPESQTQNEPTQITQNQSQAVQQQPVRKPTTEVARGTSRSDEIYWLARIIHAEAEGESYIGKVAVGNVVLNRVNNSRFPNTIYGVIYDVQEGYTQFSPVLDGRIYNTPNSESLRAAEAALNGERPVGPALYFLNPRKAENFWILQNRQFMMTLGGHDYYY